MVQGVLIAVPGRWSCTNRDGSGLKIGCKKVGFIGVSGGCRNGALIRKDFIYNGVDISHSVIDEEGISDFAIVLSDQDPWQKHPIQT